MTSIVVPAHNEAAVIGRLLDGLLQGTVSDEFEVVVVCNGCTDDTAGEAARHPGVRVVETPLPSKHAALRLGDDACSSFPRLYVDADVELTAESVRALVVALDGGVLAAVPRRRLELERRPWVVRSYYRVWEHLPTVRAGLFGRGVIAVAEAGHERVRELPDVTADDLWLHHAFHESETCIVDGAVVTVHAPRKVEDLLRRRRRVVHGAREIRRDHAAGPGASGTSRTDLLLVARERPDLVPAVCAFLAVTAIARGGAALDARRGRARVWHRDASSRM